MTGCFFFCFDENNLSFTKLNRASVYIDFHCCLKFINTTHKIALLLLSTKSTASIYFNPLFLFHYITKRGDEMIEDAAVPVVDSIHNILVLLIGTKVFLAIILPVKQMQFPQAHNARFVALQYYIF